MEVNQNLCHYELDVYLSAVRNTYCTNAFCPRIIISLMKYIHCLFYFSDLLYIEEFLERTVFHIGYWVVTNKYQYFVAFPYLMQN